jgi:hypothetical protein
VPAAVWDTRDPLVVRDYLDASNDGAAADTHGLTWVTGRQEIAAWAAVAFAHRHRFAAGPSRAAGDTVGWPYRAFADPFQLLPGVGPTEGDAEAVVRGGRITRLSFVLSPASVQRRRGEIANAAAARAAAQRPGSPLEAGPDVRPRRPQGRSAEPAGAVWPLALGGLALLASITAGRRRRRVS